MSTEGRKRQKKKIRLNNTAAVNTPVSCPQSSQAFDFHVEYSVFCYPRLTWPNVKLEESVSAVWYHWLGCGPLVWQWKQTSGEYSAQQSTVCLNVSKASLNYSPGSHGLATPQGTTSSRGQFSRLVALHFQNVLIKSTLVNITWLSLPNLAMSVLLRWDRGRECIPRVQASGFRNWLKYSLKKFLGNFFFNLRWHTLVATFTCYCVDKWHQFNPTRFFLA